MAFKSKKVKVAAPVVIDRRGGEDKDATIARQEAALERAWKERDAARDQLASMASERNRLDDRVSELMAERAK